MKKLLLTIVWTLSVLLPIKSFAQGLITDEDVEPYAVLSDENTVLTFYYDENKTANGGMGVGPFTSNVTSWFDYRAKIKKVVFDASMADCNTITSTAYWFNGCANLATIENIANLNTDNVLTMREMFNYCSTLESLDLKNFKTGKVTDMQSMFNNCSSLTYLNVQGFETAAVTDMSWMFAGCSKLTTLDVSSFNTRQVKTMHMMFSNCSELENLDLGSFTTDNATMLSYMFRGCSSLTTLDLSTFKTSSVTDMTSMFSGCSNLTTIYASKRWNTDVVTNSSGMFTGCTNLLGGNNTAYDSGHADVEYACIDGENGKPGYLTYKEAPEPEPYAVLSDDNTVLTFYYDENKSTTPNAMDVGPFNFFTSWFDYRSNIKKVVFDASMANCNTITSTAYWFNYCNNLTTIEHIEYLNTDNVTSMHGMFSSCSGLTSLDVSGFNTDNVTDMGGMFSSCSGLTSLDLNSFNTLNVKDMSYMFSGCSGLTNLDVRGFKTQNVTNMGGMFNGCSGLTSLDMTGFNTQNVTNMGAMFYNCSGLTSLGLSGFKTDNVTSMREMFFACHGLESLNLSSFKTDNVTDMSDMFFSCTGLKQLNLSGFNTENVTNMHSMFYECSSLISLDVGGFNTENVTNMSQMFYRCSSLKSLNVSGFKTQNVTDMRQMFSGCSGLTSLDVSGFKTDKVTDMGYMFSDCFSLTSLDVSGFNTDNVTNMHCMFDDCSGLTNLDVKDFNTVNVTNMGYMFRGCSGLTSLDLSSFNTLNVKDMSYMFSGCSGLTNLDVRGFKTQNVTSMNEMFYRCSTLKSLNLSSFNTENVTDMGGMFSSCSDLTAIYVGNGWTTANLTVSWGVFEDCTHLVGGAGTTYDANHTDHTYAHIDGGISNPGYLTDIKDMPEPYATLSDGNTKLTFYYDKKKDENNGMSIGPFQNYADERGWHFARTTITDVVIDASMADYTGLTSTHRWFEGFSNLTNISGLENLKMDNVTIPANMFDGCSSLTKLDLSSWNTENFGFLEAMFNECGSLTEVNLAGWKVANVTYMNYMFQNCSSLATIYVDDSWKLDETGKVTGWLDVFNGCVSLVGGKGTRYNPDVLHTGYAHIDGGPANPGYFTDINGPRPYIVLSESNTKLAFYYDDNMASHTEGYTAAFNTYLPNEIWNARPNIKSVVFDPSFADCTFLESTGSWFTECSQLESITGLEYLKTDNVTDMSDMFESCSSLTELDLSGFNTAKVENMFAMFADCQNLTTIYAGTGWTTTNVTEGNNMFINCFNLRGGQGTTYMQINVGVDYAHIDGGTSNPGYFTDKNAANFIQFEDDAVKALCVANWDKDGDGELSYDEAEAVTSLNKVFSMQKDITRFNELEYFTGLTTIEAQAFAGCIQLASITLPESIRSIGERAFQGCTSFEMVGLPMEVEHVGAYAFEGCTMLREMFTPQKLQKLERGTFANCTGLEYVMLEGPIETIADSVFAGCSRLGWIEIPQTVTSFGKYVFDGCVELHEVMMYQLTITTIPEGMFRGCAQLHHAEIPASVTKIESFAFQNCESMEEINIPSGVTSMGESNYAGCSQLIEVYTDIVNPFVINSNNFDNETYQNATLYIPTGTLQAYSTTESWKRFLHISDGKEAYAVLGEDDNHQLVLTFYYDANRANYNNTMNIEPFSAADDRGWAGAAGSIQTVRFDESFAFCATVTSTAYWFANFANLTSINGLEYLKTDNVTSMKQMFSGCANLSTLEVNGFNTENVEDMSEMFLLCQGLNHLDLSYFNTSNVKDMTSMFSMCSNLEELDLSSFSTSNVEYMSSMFFGCTNLQTIYVGRNWSTSKVKDGNQMFYECHNLRGGQGTEYSQQHTGVDYAHIDGGTANPGYLTSADGSDITEFELDGIVYRVRDRDNHKVTVVRVMYANRERYVPSEVEYGRNHWRVTALGEKAFADLHEVAVIGVPESIDSISVELFNHCTHLAAIIWETNVPLTLAAMSQYDNPNLLLFMNNTAAAPAGVTNIIDMSTNTAEKIVLTDAESGNDFYCPEPFMAKEISYTHSYDQATKIGVCQGWESIVLPFDVQTFRHETKGEIYPIASLLDEQIELDGDKPFWLYEFTQQGEFKEADKIRANTPYILSMPNDPVYWDSYILSGKVTFKANNVEVMPTEQAMYVEGGNRVFVPNYENADYNNPDAYLLNVGDAYDGHLPGSVFSAERDNRKARPFEAYFMYNGMHPAKRYIDIFDKDASSIREIPANSQTLKGAYDLTGRKVNNETTLPRGVYIIDGKKVIIK